MPPSLRRRGHRSTAPQPPPHSPSPPPAPSRRRGHAHQYPQPRQESESDDDEDDGGRGEQGWDDSLPVEGDVEDLGGDEEEDGDGDGDDEEGDEGMEDQSHLPQPQDTTPLIPPYLREISTLASWTVSSSKPGCSIPQLRSPSTTQFWQSDGPQPHYLNIHFFKLVRIVGLRLYLDFEADESYTPTRIQFLAGSGANDLQEWGELRLEQPRGWVWVGFEGVDDVEDDSGSEDEDEEEGDGDGDEARKMKHGPVLRAHLVQIKILENHQNGKDTHLRGLQIFARDRERVGGNRKSFGGVDQGVVEIKKRDGGRGLEFRGRRRMMVQDGFVIR